MSILKLSVFVLVSFTCFNESKAQSTVELPKTGIKASYMGSLTYPGFKIGIERPYKVIQIDKTKSWGTKTILKERYLTLNLGFYHHQTFHDNLFLLAEWQLRRQKSNGWFFEFAPGLGYSRTFLGGTTYKVSENGEVTKKPLAGYNYAMFSISHGFGFDFSKRKAIPLKAYVKPSLFVLAPYNSFVYIRPTVELGIICSPSDVFKAKPVLKVRTK